jgi:ABC-type Na+ efflux pump permease subunit
MSPLVKKEIRLLLPSFLIGVALSFGNLFLKDYQFGFNAFVAVISFFSCSTIAVFIALNSFGAEISSGTFSMLLAQPISRHRIWRTKTLLLAAALLIGGFLWCLILYLRFEVLTHPKDLGDFWDIFLGTWLFLLAIYSGALWTVLLFRQMAAAFWFTLLTPGAIVMLIAGLWPEKYASACEPVVIAALLIYGVAGIWFARRLFLQAQDVQWTGGTIALPETRGASSFLAGSAEKRFWRPNTALFWKELQLYNISLLCACVLLGLHIVVIFLRMFCSNFHGNSLADTASGFVWILWLAMPLIIGSITVAEERKLGVMEGQLCLPVSRRFQFTLKFLLAMFLGTLFGGVMPLLLEYIASGCGVPGSMFEGGSHTDNEFGSGLVWFQIFIAAWAGGLSLVCFFASTLAKNFLQALSIAIVTGIVCALLISAIGFVSFHHTIFFGITPWHSVLPFLIAIPVFAATLLWLAWLNFNHFHESWRLWRRNILGIAGALVFIAVSSTAIYNRAWEVFEPTEVAHGTAKLSLAHPPTIQVVQYQNLLVRLPDGRVWFDELGDSPYNYYGGSVRWKYLWRMLVHPLRESIGPQQFLAGSNWVAATTEHMYFGWNDAGKNFHATDFMETVGIQPDGTLWISEKPERDKWTAGTLQRFGSETNWRQLAQSRTSVVLLKTDGTLWRWGCLTNELHQWPGLRTFTPYQIGTNFDWQELFTVGWIFARQTDGRVWRLSVDWKTGKDELGRVTNYDEIVSQTASRAGDNQTAFVRADGTLWVLNRYWDEKSRQTLGTGILQVGKENDWRAVAVSYGMMVALKADGSLWQWHFLNPWNMSKEQLIFDAQKPATRLGIHNDWVAIAQTWEGVIALVADGSLWLWPDREQYEEHTLLKLPKQPQFLGNVLSRSD